MCKMKEFLYYRRVSTNWCGCSKRYELILAICDSSSLLALCSQLRLGTNWSWKSQTLIWSLIFFCLPTLFHRFLHDFRFTFLRKLTSSSISLYGFLIVRLLRFQYSSSNHNLCFLYNFHTNIDWFFFFFFWLWVQAQRDCKAQSKRLLVLVVWEMCF